MASRRARRRFLASSILAAVAYPGGSLLLGQLPAGVEFQRFFTAKVQQAITRGLEYLASQQNQDGSFGSGGYSRNTAICGLCGMAFLAQGSAPGRGRYGVHLRQSVNFILQNCQQSGLISHDSAASRGPMYGHGFATLFLAEVYGMSRVTTLRGKLAKAVELIINTQNSAGGWRYEPRRSEADISVTVCQVMALRAARNAGLHVPNETVDLAIRYIKRCQNPDDGGFMYMATQPGESEFPRSAAAIVALYSAGVYEGDEVDRGLAYLMQHPPRSNELGQQSYYLYGHYYAVQAMWHAGGDYFKTWYPAIRDLLLAQQHPDGYWRDTIGDAYGTAMACLVLQMPSNYLPIFQR